MKVALIGGSFDPIHKGHIQVAKHVLKNSDAEEIWLIPSKDTPLKERKQSAFSHRFNMCKLAAKPYRNIHVCAIENEFQGKSYTIQTVKALKNRYPEHEFSWIIGTDQLKQLDKWKDIDELLKLVKMIVVDRDIEEVVSTYPVEYLRMPLYKISSTEIRNGKQMYELDDAVRNYIGKHHLYLNDIVPLYMSDKRWQHSLRVANLCKRMAKAHHLDEEKAYRMGMYHDICKQTPYEEAKQMIDLHFPQYITQAPAIWHGYLGAYVLQHKFHVRDKDILQAVYHHVLGNSFNPYAMILFCADKLEEGRGYDSSKEIQMCLNDLYKGFLEVRRQQQAYIAKEK